MTIKRGSLGNPVVAWEYHFVNMVIVLHVCKQPILAHDQVSMTVAAALLFIPCFADVAVPAGEPLSGQFDGHRHLFEWKERDVKMKLSDNTSILSFTISIHDMASSSHRFKLPPSVTCCSKIYELVCTHSNSDNTGADFTIPYQRESGSRPSFYLAKKTPQWECDLTPVYAFRDTKNGTFDQSLASYSVQNFNCYICVCSKL